MVRRIELGTLDTSALSDTASFDGRRGPSRESAASSVARQENELVEAFVKFCKAEQAKDFDEAVKRWIKGRREANRNCVIDPEDPDRRTPGHHLKEKLLGAFNTRVATKLKSKRR